MKAIALLGLLLCDLVLSADDNLGLDNGYLSSSTNAFALKIGKTSQVLASLQPLTNSDFDFLPFDVLPYRAFNGAHQIGDITLRYRIAGNGSWTSIDSASNRQAVKSLNLTADNVIAAADLGPTLADPSVLKVTREWLRSGDDIVARFNVTNTADASLEIGSLGLPIAINNIFFNRTDTNTQANCSLADPYIGLDAGYVRVTPVKGTGSALVITPLEDSHFEAWRYLEEPEGDLLYHSQVYEGNYEWQVHTLAYAQHEWSSVTPWNRATSKSLNTGDVYSVGLKFSLAASIQTIEDTVSKTDTPLAVGFPGYIIPQDLVATLHVNYSSEISSVESDGAFDITKTSESTLSLKPNSGKWGRAPVTINYKNGKQQVVHYYITKSAPEVVADLGHFVTTKQYFNKTADPFGRASSVMTYDREVNAIVEQDNRAWISGISDEGGSGSYLSAVMKQYIQPSALEVELLDTFVHKTLWGTVQRNGSYGVVNSVFYYQPNETDYAYDPSIDWTTWSAWNKERALATGRAYNYIHVTAAYWAMYRTARDYPSIHLQSDWQWYINQAYNTIQFCFNDEDNCGYALVGLMEETVLGELLADLKRENMTEKHDAFEANLLNRVKFWASLPLPFASEMSWDSTGQEGVYYWSNYFGYNDLVELAVNSIIGYMPTVAHWGWNGNARRYWDFLYGGKLQRIERQLHHYGSGLNALPLLSNFRVSPNATNFYDLRVGYGGTFGPLSNVDQEGFGSAAFHSWPDTLKWDAYSGDYGQNFLGLALGHSTYLVEDEKYGFVTFGGNAEVSETSVTVEPRDAVRKRVFVAPLGLFVEISAGAIGKFVYDRGLGIVTLFVDAAVSVSGPSVPEAAEQAVIWLSLPGDKTTSYEVKGSASQTRGGWVVTLDKSKSVEVQIVKV